MTPLTPHGRFMAAARLYGTPYGVTPAMLLSSCRFGIVVAVRAMLIHHCRHVFGWSLSKIGRKLGRDHTTILVTLRRTPEEWSARLAHFSRPASVRDLVAESQRQGGPSRAIAVELAAFYRPVVAANDDHPTPRRALTWRDALRMSAEWGDAA